MKDSLFFLDMFDATIGATIEFLHRVPLPFKKYVTRLEMSGSTKECDIKGGGTVDSLYLEHPLA